MHMFAGAARSFIKAEDCILPVSSIEKLDLSDIEQGIVRATVAGAVYTLTGFDAFDALMLIHPAAMEGRRLRWAKNAWALHNLIAHPLMQVLVWLGFRRAGLWLHDVTVPRPAGIRG